MKILKNGFTFVELLAVITIIGIISLIAVPTLEIIIKENKEQVYQTQLDNIVLALKNWASDNKDLLPNVQDDTLTLTLGSLKADGYVDYELKNPKNNKCFDNEMVLIIKKEKKNYGYSIDLDTIKETDRCETNYEMPLIILNGSIVEEVEVNSAYVDKGVIAKDKNGNDITDDVIKVISGNFATVETSMIGSQYIINYSVTSDDVTVKTSRTVKIVDTIAPTIYIPANITIGTDVTSLDLMEGVSATDNSDEEITVGYINNIIYTIPGNYTVTYTAVDSSGNKTIKNRIITIEQ